MHSESRPRTSGADGLVVDANHVIPRRELEVRASRSGGPGGQHVNVTASRVELRWNPGLSRALAPEERERVAAQLASRLDAEGFVRVVASNTRSQRQNRALAEHRLASLVRRALVVPKARKATRPSPAAREARLVEKRRKSEKKRERRGGNWD
jgi:ribosome-associated protein